MVDYAKRQYLAENWLYRQDPVAYFLAMASKQAVYPQNNQIIMTMTDTQRTYARKAQDGTWKKS